MADILYRSDLLDPSEFFFVGFCHSSSPLKHVRSSSLNIDFPIKSSPLACSTIQSGAKQQSQFRSSARNRPDIPTPPMGSGRGGVKENGSGVLGVGEVEVGADVEDNDVPICEEVCGADAVEGNLLVDNGDAMISLQVTLTTTDMPQPPD